LLRAVILTRLDHKLIKSPRKETMAMKRNQFVRGIAVPVLVALIFLFLKTSVSIPVAIILTVIGITLVDTSRRR
jgi:hypothetical protein